MSISIFKDELPSDKNPNRPYRYYDTPDGQDGIKKLIYTTTIAGKVGTFVAITDIMLGSKPKGVIPTIGRFAYVLTPFVGTATAFTMTTYLATHIRQKDDVVNYMCGGIAAGSVYGKWRNSFRIGFNACAAYAITGIIVKHLHLDGIPLFPQVDDTNRVANPDLWTFTRDYSITRDPPRTWTR